MQTRFETRGDFYYFDFILSKNLSYNESTDIEIDAFPVIHIDQLWINVISNISSSFSIQIFDEYPIPNEPIGSLKFIGAHYFTDFHKIDENLFSRDQDILYFYETGFTLRGIRIKRLGKTGEHDCIVRLKLICRKVV